MHLIHLYPPLPKHALELVKILSNRLRSTSKIVRSIVDEHHDESENGSSTSSKKKVLKVLCYDTTSWVKETFEPQVSFQLRTLYYLNYAR